MVGILYCSKSALAYKEIEAILLASGIKAVCIAIEEADSNSLEQFSLIINAMDSYYVEEKVSLLVDYFNSGKNIINLCATPFTRNCNDERDYNRILRSFGIVDDFRPVSESSTYVKTPDGKRLDVKLTGLCGAVYHLCERDENRKTSRCAYLEHILDAYDENDDLIAPAMIRVVTHNKGSMSFLGFDFEAAMLKNEFWNSLFLDLVQKELIGNVLVTVDSSFARYLPNEQKNITIKVENINVKASTSFTLSLSIYDSSDSLVFEQKETATFPYEATISPELTASSLYHIVADVSIEGTVLTRKQTGFLVISDEEMSSELKQFKPMYIDETVSSEYCLIDGKITAILGTTYFVTDVYRECFYYMNAWLCNKEMTQLKKDGFNVLRSGNWCYIPDLYEADGSIAKRGIRALQTYFFLAAKNDFTVQFALGNVMLNQWDDSLSPIHNSQMRQKCMTLVRSFAGGFQNFPNVTLDIVNEPSYSNKGAWSTARPSGEAGELNRYREWLCEKYDGKIEKLRIAWGESSFALRSFDDIKMPDSDLFMRGLCRTEQRKNHPALTDFFLFARHEFLDWTAEVRATVRKYAPKMLVVMGRDETLRIPSQQDEVLAGNIDMVCWHQWHFNSNLLTEYLLNRVRGKICVAQELGMYKYDDIRSGKRHNDQEMAAKIEKKLLCSFGNFVQWQAHDDPFMFELSENALGLYRADMSLTPSLRATRTLIAAEKSMQSHMHHKQEDKTKIVTVYNTSYHFSVDTPIALHGIRNHVYALHNCVREQTDFMLEHLFTSENKNAIGNPKLIILPAMQTLSRAAWDELLEYVKKGTVLLINGCIDKDEFFADDDKIRELDSSYTTRKLIDFEKITIGNQEFCLDFRHATSLADVSNIINCGQLSGENRIVEYPVGNGMILYCPLPIEFSSNKDAICACYEYAIQKANAQNDIYRIVDGKPHILLTAAAYEDCTVYTLINEGFADTFTWLDLRSNKELTVSLKEISGCKLWISSTGEILQKYGDIQI